jgi:hypothetical protein
MLNMMPTKLFASTAALLSMSGYCLHALLLHALECTICARGLEESLPLNTFKSCFPKASGEILEAELLPITTVKRSQPFSNYFMHKNLLCKQSRPLFNAAGAKK